MLSFVANPNFEITPNSLIAKKCPELSPEERCRCAFGLEVAAWLAHHSKVLAYKQVPLTETNKNKKEFAEIVADAEQLVPNQKILYELLYTVVRKPSLPQDLKTIHLKKVIKPNKESEIEIKK